MRIVRIPGRDYSKKVVENAQLYKAAEVKEEIPENIPNNGWMRFAITRNADSRLSVYINNYLAISTTLVDDTWTVEFDAFIDNESLSYGTESLRVTDGVDRYAAGNSNTG